MVIKINNEDFDKVKELLDKNNINYESDTGAYIMSLKDDIRGTWDGNYDKEPPKELLDKVLDKMLNDDSAYSQYDERIDEYIEEVLKEYI